MFQQCRLSAGRDRYKEPRVAWCPASTPGGWVCAGASFPPATLSFTGVWVNSLPLPAATCVSQVFHRNLQGPLDVKIYELGASQISPVYLSELTLSILWSLSAPQLQVIWKSGWFRTLLQPQQLQTRFAISALTRAGVVAITPTRCP